MHHIVKENVLKKVTEKSPYKFINPDFVKRLSSLIKAETEKEKVKLIRAKLHKISTSTLPIRFYKKFEKLDFSKEILNLHRSTRERLPIYPKLIEKIKQANPKTILDLGCGFNLLAFYYFNCIPEFYVGYDIDCAVIKFISRFTKEKKINAKIECKDILEIDFPRADLCICLKVLDALEDVEKNISKKILEKLKTKCRSIIVSFSNISLGGKKRLKEREWFEKFLSQLQLKWYKETLGNETFYFIKI